MSLKKDFHSLGGQSFALIAMIMARCHLGLPFFPMQVATAIDSLLLANPAVAYSPLVLIQAMAALEKVRRNPCPEMGKKI
jgi:hypothetical protein